MDGLNEILEITPGIPLMLSSTSKGDAMKWYQPETNCYLKANRVDHGREYQDAIAEVIASRVGELLHILVVQYQLCHIRIDDEKLLLVRSHTTSVTRTRVLFRLKPWWKVRMSQFNGLFPQKKTMRSSLTCFVR